MLIFQLKDTLKNSKDPDWEKLLSLGPGQDIHPGRKLGYCLAREALKGCFKNFGHELEITDLELDSFDSLKKLPGFTLSLSHTSRWGAALVGKKIFYSSVGLDIEPVDRNVKQMVIDRISHPEDVKLKPIQHWALKEASFKALMNTRKFDKPLEFSSIRIEEKTWSHESGLSGKWDLEIISELVVAKAWMENQSSARP